MCHIKLKGSITFRVSVRAGVIVRPLIECNLNLPKMEYIFAARPTKMYFVLLYYKADSETDSLLSEYSQCEDFNGSDTSLFQ